CQILCCGSMKLSSLASMLTGVLGRPVIDKTGLQGYYFFNRIAWAGGDATASPLPALPTLLRDKFGLEYRSEVGSVPVLVIGHVAKLQGN
ncbi:MAG TPA: TIGR03435 family protein, partial [Terriglobales bacterium]|nr:TIGR03435 family protein [Terriglobales bacterium]